MTAQTAIIATLVFFALVIGFLGWCIVRMGALADARDAREHQAVRDAERIVHSAFIRAGEH